MLSELQTLIHKFDLITSVLIKKISMKQGGFQQTNRILNIKAPYFSLKISVPHLCLELMMEKKKFNVKAIITCLGFSIFKPSQIS